MDNVENFINIWVSHTSENIGHILEGYAGLDLILSSKINYSYGITWKKGIHQQTINKIVGILKDINNKSNE